MEVINKTHYSVIIDHHLFPIDVSHSCAPPPKTAELSPSLLVYCIVLFIYFPLPCN